MSLSVLKNPSAFISRNIENLMIQREEHSSMLLWGACGVTSRIVSAIVFPLILTLELLLKRLPKALAAAGTENFGKQADKALKYSLAIIPAALLGLPFPEGVPGFFLKRKKTENEIRPFGVERVFGKAILHPIEYPQSAKDVEQIVKSARMTGQQISIIGAGMSQGTQTVPDAKEHRVIHTRDLNNIQVNASENTVTVGAGATWEQIQLALDKVNKSAIVKQASDIFSVGGSIGMNCHGWAHEYGPISSTVRSLKVVDADGNLRTLIRPRQGISIDQLTDDELLFKCQFGTLGYFGVIVEATLDILDNEELIETTEEVDRDQFVKVYENEVKGQDVQLFGGRMVLDSLDGDPMRNICMVSYRKPITAKPLTLQPICAEPVRGTRIERIGLKLISQLPNFAVKKLISYFWESEKAAMLKGRIVTRNEALHPPINAFKILHNSDLYAQWLQEYFIDKDRLANFLRFLGAELKANDVRMINATIRPTPNDDISVLPYAEKDRYAVVICFAQKKSEKEMARTRQWIENVNAYLAAEGGIFYQAYMPYATREQFETCYGPERVKEMRTLKERFDPCHVFGNAHTAKYYDKEIGDL